MNTLTVDVAVIGAGSAGLTAYSAARSHDKRVVLIEGGAYGTTCARVGCMPSKLLIAAADAAHAVGGAPAFGVGTTAPVIDGAAVMARVRAERDRFVGFVLDDIENIAQEDRLRGHARFIADNRVQIDEHTVVEAGSFVIATGSRPHVPKEFVGLGTLLLTSDELFYRDSLPQSIAVIGTGIIGLELGQALHRLGVLVTIFGRGDQLGHASDPAVQAASRDCLGAQLDLRCNTKILDAQRDGDGVLLRSRDEAGKERSERFACVLVATGRLPNIESLGLEHTALALDARGVPLFDAHTMRCGDSSIYIAGDVSNERPLQHEAVDQGRIAGHNAGRHPQAQAGLRRTPLAVAFTDPQIAVAGRSYRELASGSFAIGELAFSDQGRSRVMRQNRGLLRVYGEPGSGRFLGAEMIGPCAEHLAHLLAWACQAGMTVEQMLEMPFYHPVVEEGVRTALRDLRRKLHRPVPEIERCADCSPGA